MIRLTFTDAALLKSFIKEAKARGGIGMCVTPLDEGVTELWMWDL